MSDLGNWEVPVLPTPESSASQGLVPNDHSLNFNSLVEDSDTSNKYSGLLTQW